MIVAEVMPLPVPPGYRPPDDLDIVALSALPDQEGWLAEHGNGIGVLVTHAGHGAPRELLQRLTGLKLVAHFGAGLDLLDLDLLRERGVALTYTADLLTDDVADLALMLMLGGLRRIVECDRFIRAGAWGRTAPPLGRSAAGRRVGVYGLGRIGHAFARRAAACGCTIGYHGRSAQQRCDYAYFSSLHDLAQWSDVLVAAVPGAPETTGAINGDVLQALGPDGLLVNVARGAVVDESALIDALAQGRIAAAALDVFDKEPAIDPRFLALSNVTLTPHIGSLTSDTRGAMADHVYGNVRRHLTGAPLIGRFFHGETTNGHG
ncbi:MAG: 2-hydroxyacid dehydrogenase [Sphingobium sp.]|uniref:2-hydroxyacid dehydrogenase n=1 Tax=Sphingobium sp. TaxID=1912891 RepID=UPI002E1D85E5